MPEDLKRIVPRFSQAERQDILQQKIELSFAAVLKAIADFLEVCNKIADRD